MNQLNQDIDFYKILSILSPFVSASLAGILTYYFTLKAKKFDILYQNKIPAFKEIAGTLVDFKKFCWGRTAYFHRNEFSPYYEENVGTLEHRIKISDSSEYNSIFLSADCKQEIDNLLSEMSGLCNAEISLVSGNEMPGVEDEYERIALTTEKCIKKLYDDLNLKHS